MTIQEYINNIPLKYNLGEYLLSDWIPYKKENEPLFKEAHNIQVDNNNFKFRVVVKY